ncbi:NUDIX hydrolase [Halovenus halobia]|uniref:NUDIX hydrolase n=1 Tax=Halovenus halobia TaxID=3396622 RepID=UPI003F57ADE7
MSSEATHQHTQNSRYRVSAKALLTTDERILIVNERHGDGQWFWTLPGGGVRPDETPPTALVRELREELQCSAQIRSQLRTLWYAHVSAGRAVSKWQLFHCRLTAPAVPNLSASILDARWVTVDELPPNTLLPARHLLETLSLPTLS